MLSEIWVLTLLLGVYFRLKYTVLLFQKLKHYFSNPGSLVTDKPPHEGYNLWAESYDSQQGNLMLALDEEVFSALLNPIHIKDKIIADVGCGTGRHWKKLTEKKPQKIIGFDVSKGMLKILRQKFPLAETHLLLNNNLGQLKNKSCDMVISTLTIAHIKNAEEAITEWNRVLKPGGHMIITDYHPLALAKGARRTFRHHNKTVAVKNYVHHLEKLEAISRQLNLHVVRLIERSIDESVKSYYESQNAVPVFELWKGVPIIYGLYLKKPDATL